MDLKEELLDLKDGEIKNIVDIKGQKIQVGDVIFKVKFSKLNIHKVLKITKKSLVISIYRDFRIWGIEPYGRKHYFIRGTKTLESLKEHNDIMYIPIRYAQHGVIKY